MSKRRGNGEGSIYQRACGRWCGTIAVGYAANGKRRRRTVFGETKREVQEKLTRLASQKLDGALGDPTKLRVAQYLTRWLEDAARPTIRQTTYRLYEMVIRRHINAHVGGVPLAKLTPAHIQSMYSAMERAGASARLRQICHSVLRRSLGQALEWGMMGRNVCLAVKPPKAAKPAMETLTPPQVGLLLNAAEGDRLHALYVLAVTTGLRQGELLGLQWPDVDLQAGALAIRHTLSEVAGKLWLSEPKTSKGRRRVDLPQIAVEALIEHRKRMVAEGHAGCAWVFCDTRGGPMRKSALRRRSFEPLLRKAGLPRIRFHDLRHTAATLMFAEGVHPKIVQERLGHATIGITLDTYSHVLPSMQKEAAEKVGRLLKAVVG